MHVRAFNNHFTLSNKKLPQKGIKIIMQNHFQRFIIITFKAYTLIANTGKFGKIYVNKYEITMRP